MIRLTSTWDPIGVAKRFTLRILLQKEKFRFFDRFSSLRLVFTKYWITGKFRRSFYCVCFATRGFLSPSLTRPVAAKLGADFLFTFRGTSCFDCFVYLRWLAFRLFRSYKPRWTPSKCTRQSVNRINTLSVRNCPCKHCMHPLAHFAHCELQIYLYALRSFGESTRWHVCLLNFRCNFSFI